MRRFLLVLPVLGLILAMGCQSGGVSQAEVDQLTKKVTALEQKVENLKPTMVTEEGKKVEVATKDDLKALKDEVASLKKEIAGLKKDLSDLRSRYESHLKKYHK